MYFRIYFVNCNNTVSPTLTGTYRTNENNDEASCRILILELGTRFDAIRHEMI